jgi:hypothetical protein
MGIPMAYNTGTTNTYTEKTVKRGTVALNPGPTLAPSYNWFNGVDVTATQYLIYSDTYTTGQATQANSRPTAWTTPDLSDTSLLNLINTLPERIGQTPFTYAPVALKWLHQSNRYFLLKNNFENIVTSGLVLNLDGSWPNSYSGTTTWFDLSGQGNNGTLTNGPTLNTSNGGSIQFDGTNDYCVVNSNSNSSLSGDFSITQWYNAAANDGGYRVIFETNGYRSGTSGIAIYQFSNYFRIWRIIGGTYTELITTSGNTVGLNTWKTFTLVRNSGVFTFYIDTIYSGTYSTDTNNYSDTSYHIGGDGPPTSSYWFQGNIATTQVYNRALSPAEIMQNFNTQGYRFGYSADTIVTSGLVFNFDAGDGMSYPGTGTTVYNISNAGGYNGTLTNGATWSAGTRSSFVLDGTDDQIDCGSVDVLGGATGATWEAWFKVNTINNSSYWKSIMTTWNDGFGSNGHTWLFDTHYASWSFSIRFVGDTSDYPNIFWEGGTGRNDFVANTWYQMVGVFDSSQANADKLKIYINGSYVASQDIGNRTTIAYKIANENLKIGVDRDVAAPFDGNIAITRLYRNKGLSASEVLQNYNALKGRFGL